MVNKTRFISLTLLAGLILSNGLKAQPALAAFWAALPTISAKLELPSIIKPDLNVGQRVEDMTDAINWGAESISYLTDKGAPAINGLSKSIDTLVYEGIYKGVKQAGICATGVLATASGLGIITHTILNDNAKNKKTKYALGAGLTALGIATVLSSNWIASLSN